MLVVVPLSFQTDRNLNKIVSHTTILTLASKHTICHSPVSFGCGGKEILEWKQNPVTIAPLLVSSEQQ